MSQGETVGASTSDNERDRKRRGEGRRKRSYESYVPEWLNAFSEN